jgi:hypothetical protein
MPSSLNNLQSYLVLAVLCCAILLLNGCAQVGPNSISRGRAAYNEAITRTDDEQLLMSIVKGRYGESYNMLAITGVAANIRFSARAEAQFGIGSSESYAGNLIPLSSGVAYEENPTITYAPAQGAEYLRQLNSPIPLDTLILLVRTSRNPGSVITMLVETVNGLLNADFIPEEEKLDAKFTQFVRISSSLARARVLHWVRDATIKDKFYFVLTGYDPDHIEDVEAILSLLGLPIPKGKDKGEDIALPVVFALRGREWGGIGITTRSTAELLEIMQARVEVPEEHLKSGVAITYPPVGLPGQGIRIPVSRERPANAWVAVRYRGYWFYVDETDQPTKRAFKSVRTMFQLSIATAAEDQPAPVLTVPVAR